MPLFDVTVTATYPDAAPRPADEVLEGFADGGDRRANRDAEAGEWRLTVAYVVRETSLVKAKNRALEQFTQEAEAAGVDKPWQVRLTSPESADAAG